MASEAEDDDESQQMALLQSIIDYNSDATSNDDVRNSKGTSRSSQIKTFSSGGFNGISDQKKLPALSQSAERPHSMTNGKKTTGVQNSIQTPTYSRKTPGKTSSTDIVRQSLTPPLSSVNFHSPYEFKLQQMMLSRYQELSQLLHTAVQKQPPNQMVLWQERMLSASTPKKLAAKKHLGGRNHRLSLSEFWNPADDAHHQDHNESIEVVSEDSRTESPAVEIVEIIEDRDPSELGSSTGKKVTFNPETTVRIAYEVEQRHPNTGKKNNGSYRKLSNPKSLENDQLRRAQTDVGLPRDEIKHKERQNGKALRTKKITEQDENSFVSYRMSKPGDREHYHHQQHHHHHHHHHLSPNSTSHSCNLRERLWQSRDDETDEGITHSEGIRILRGQRIAYPLIASWSYSVPGLTLDQRYAFTDHRLRSTDNLEISNWLEQKNRILRKQRQEKLKRERKIRREENEKQKENAAHRLERQEKVRQWMKEKKKVRYSKKLKVGLHKTEPIRSDSQQSGISLKNSRHTTELEATAAPDKKHDSDRDADRSHVNSKGSEVTDVQKQRARSRSGLGRTKQQILRKDTEKVDATHVEQQKHYQDWLKKDRENYKDSVLMADKKKKNTTPTAGQKTNKKLKDRTDSALHNPGSTSELPSSKSGLPDSHRNPKSDHVSSKDEHFKSRLEARLEPQGSDFKEESNDETDKKDETTNYHDSNRKGSHDKIKIKISHTDDKTDSRDSFTKENSAPSETGKESDSEISSDDADENSANGRKSDMKYSDEESEEGASMSHGMRKTSTGVYHDEFSNSSRRS